jgi:hypothetical protein
VFSSYISSYIYIHTYNPFLIIIAFVSVLLCYHLMIVAFVSVFLLLFVYNGFVIWLGKWLCFLDRLLLFNELVCSLISTYYVFCVLCVMCSILGLKSMRVR